MAESPEKAFSSLRLQDFSYQLPDEAIAKHPLSRRDESRLLLYNKGQVSHHRFRQLSDLLPKGSRLFFNNTKVIPARLHFRKDTGAIIEIFLLQPVAPSANLQEALAQTRNCSWLCLVGNQKRWKEGTALEQILELNGQTVKLNARLESKEKGLVHFEWEANEVNFAELVEASGEIPLPPYLNRQAEEKDKTSYQTVYSLKEGAVAAPTAGLHFTEEVLEELKEKGISTHYLTLHVGAGTFRPIKDKVEDHPMHREQLLVSRQNVEDLLYGKGKVIAVGTTSMRTLESLYWFGVKLLTDPDSSFFITKEEAYTRPPSALPDLATALQEVLKKMERDKVEEIWGETEIFIVPSYRFRICEGLITNFHQPESTLILLVAAFLGDDWRKVYQQALSGGYRFLSYGDSSLLLP